MKKGKFFIIFILSIILFLLVLFLQNNSNELKLGIKQINSLSNIKVNTFLPKKDLIIEEDNIKNPTKETEKKIQNKNIINNKEKHEEHTYTNNLKNESIETNAVTEKTPNIIKEVESPVVNTALSLIGTEMWCEELVEKSINSIGKSAWITIEYMDGDAIVEEKTLAPTNFLKISHKISFNDKNPGDLVYYENINHIAIYIGNNQIVHGGINGKNVEINDIIINNENPIILRIN